MPGNRETLLNVRSIFVAEELAEELKNWDQGINSVAIDPKRFKRFGIPTEYGVVVTMPIGYPMGKFGPVRRKPAVDKTFFERWGDNKV